MIAVRTTIQGTFGTGGQLAAELAAATKDIFAELPTVHRLRILTDLTGGFDRAIIEIVTDSLATWEHLRQALLRHPRFQRAMAAVAATVAGGSVDIFTIEAEW